MTQLEQNRAALLAHILPDRTDTVEARRAIAPLSAKHLYPM